MTKAEVFKVLVSGIPSKLALSAAYCLLSFASFSQLNYDFQAGKFLIKGKVIDLQTKTPIPMANVRINGTGKGVTCDNDGNFAFYVSKKDTLRFSSTGYLTKLIHIYDLDSSKYYTLEIQLMHDFVKLKEVTIYPFKNKDEFVDAFLDAKVNKVVLPGVAPPKYGTVSPRAKFNNPVSFFYERLKKRRVANPDFRP